MGTQFICGMWGFRKREFTVPHLRSCLWYSCTFVIFIHTQNIGPFLIHTESLIIPKKKYYFLQKWIIFPKNEQLLHSIWTPWALPVMSGANMKYGSGWFLQSYQIWFWSELIFGGTSATGGRVIFFVSCVNFLKKQCKMLYNFNPTWFH